MTMVRAGLARVLSRRRDLLSRCSLRASDLLPRCGPGPGSADSSGRSPMRGVLDQRAMSSASTGEASKQKGENIYLHHSDVGSVVSSAGLTIGLMHSLQALCPGAGYFRPIDHTSHGGKRAELIREIFAIRTPIEDMVGCTQEEASGLISSGRMDDLLEMILPAYERCKAQHDYVVVEGTSLRDGSNTSPVNGVIASTLGCPALILNDAEAAARNKYGSNGNGGRDMGEVEWEREAVGSVVDHSRIMQQYNVDVTGALLYRVPRTSRGLAKLHSLMEGTGIPLVGAIPADSKLEGLQVEDIRRVLDAEQIYGHGEAGEGALATDINKIAVATLHLEDFLSHIPDAESATEGALVVTHASRPDVLLGMLALHETSLPTHVAALVLTGGSYPPIEVDNLIRARPTPCSLPILLSPMDTGKTVMTIAEAKPQIHATSTRKIERAEVLFQNHVDLEALHSALFKEHEMLLNPKMFQHNIFVKARQAQQHIVLPEGSEPRTVQAAGEILRRGLCRLTMLGDPGEIQAQAKKFRVDLGGAELVNPADSPLLDDLAELVHERRKHKGITLEHAHDLLAGDATSFGTAMVAAGKADGMVSGAIHTTASTVRPALQIIKTFPETPLVSSAFFMCLPDKVLVYADCAVNENPTPEELATIAISSADTAQAFGIEPRVAMLSYATGDSNQGPIIQKVADATALAKQKRPDLMIEGPLQYDAAVNPETARTKMKGKESQVAGKATVLIFPDLNTGNNTYKAVQQSTGAVAMGPVLQGLRKPVNDLSRGCTVKDIVTTVAITAVQAYGMKQEK